MKSIIIILAAAFAMIGSATSFAAETSTITLDLPPGFSAEACRTPVWNNTQVVWEGVTDKRKSKEIGVQNQGKKDPVAIMASPSLDLAFDKAIRELLTACGMRMIEKGEVTTPHISVDIDAFFVGVEKKILTGTANAESMIDIKVRAGASANSQKIGFEINSKAARSGKLKQLEKVALDLFAETLAQIPKNQDSLNIQ